MASSVLRKALSVLAAAVLPLLALALAIDSPCQASDLSRVQVLLDVPYGSGPGSVGATKAGETGSGDPPSCPEMFQMTADGTIWVLDTVNSRILPFKDGQQTGEIPVVDLKKHPSVFGVTRDAVWVKKVTTTKGECPAFSLLRYDRRSSSWTTVSLGLGDGTQMDALDLMPLGADETSLLIRGVQTSNDATGATSAGSAVLHQAGGVYLVDSGDGAIPATDGSIWRFRPISRTLPQEVTFSLEKYSPQARQWEAPVSSSLPRREELSKARQTALTLPLGLDEQGRLTVVLFEGKPLSQRFVRVAPSGAVIRSMALEDLGYDSAPLGRYFPPMHYQLLSDGSILAQYATPERYRIIRIYW